MFVMGVDIGSTACKAVVMRDGEEIVARSVISLGTGTSGVQRVFDDALEKSGLKKADLGGLLATGYGRFTFRETDSQKSELSCHAKGVKFILPSARTIIDIGGQDIKVLRLNAKGHMENFIMNDKCAAGTGKFLDVMATILNLKTTQLGALGEKATGEVSISNTCTVFAESEVISKLSADVKLEDLVAGIHRSVAKRVASLAMRNGIVEDVAMSGGVALNSGVVKLLEDELKTKILVHNDCQLAGAIGAALFAYEEKKRVRE